MTMSLNGYTKLIEECGELVQVCAKKIAYYNTDNHPDGKGSLSTRIEEELADVLAACQFVAQVNSLDLDQIHKRSAEKLETYYRWHEASE